MLCVNKLLRTLWLLWRARSRSKLAITDTGMLRMRVRPTDIDVLRHMNNGVYLSIADLGRMDLLIRCGAWDELNRRGWYPVVVNETITFRRSLDLWQVYELQTRFIGVDDRGVYIEQRFVVDGEIFAKAVIRGRFLKRSGGTVPVADLAKALGVDVDALQLPEWVTRWAADVALPSTREAAPSDW